MLKIFVPEYIIFIEEINFSLNIDTMFFSLEHIILFKDVDINFSSSRAGIKAQESMALYQTKN